jgi:hypothetical protein
MAAGLFFSPYRKFAGHAKEETGAAHGECKKTLFLSLWVESPLFNLKGLSHEKVYEFLTWDGSFSLN